MRRSILSSIEIGAPPPVVWAALTDLAAYDRWNPYIVSASGTVEAGARLSLRMQVAGRTFRVRPRLVQAEEGRVLCWMGRLGIPGVLDAWHAHHLQAIPGGTRYVQHERFNGILVRFVGATLTATEAAFRAMNEALEQRVTLLLGEQPHLLDDTAAGRSGGSTDHLG